MRDHEVDVLRPHELGGHDQVALVLAVLVVHDHDHAAGAEFVEEFGDGGEAHGVWVPAGGAPVTGVPADVVPVDGIPVDSSRST